MEVIFKVIEARGIVLFRFKVAYLIVVRMESSALMKDWDGGQFSFSGGE
jgi:hypothetical protein